MKTYQVKPLKNFKLASETGTAIDDLIYIVSDKRSLQ